MRRLIVLFVMLAFAVGVAGAESAIIVDGGTCGVPGADADGNLIGGGPADVVMRVENGNKVMLKCQGTGVTNLSEQGQSFEGFVCGLYVPSSGTLVFTTESHATVSASGNATMMCTFRKP